MLDRLGDLDSRIELRVVARSHTREVPYRLVIATEWGQKDSFHGDTPVEVWDEFVRRHAAEEETP